MAWTDYDPTADSDWSNLEPPGFGNIPWGDPSSAPEGTAIHGRGWGAPKTVWQDYTES